MAQLMRYATPTRTAQANALAALLNGGALRIYDGARPATADTAVGAQVMLAELALPNPAATVANGVITLNAIADATIAASGTAAWFRLVTAGGATVADGNVGTADADLVLPTTALAKDATLSITGGTITVPANG